MSQTMTPGLSGLFDSCFPTRNSYDEIRLPDGTLRQHWRPFIDQMSVLGIEQLQERSNSCKRILRNHGVTYHVSTREGDTQRPWELDLVPFIINQEEWATIEKGVIQRARLHNLILQDIYDNPQYLLRNGDIPPALLYANPNFLRACRGVPVPQQRYLQLHAVDLARSPNGQWWVLDDRMQSPNGLGYALENRSIIGRVHQDLFSHLGVRGLGRFFGLLRQNMLSLNPNLDRYPRVVFLTPGSNSPAHYEHSLLARYLGYTLVEGGDLMVRDNCVFMKTVEGPQKVDVILRRVNDTLCDPIELDQNSFSGIPGLIQAARTGNVAIANSLGSAVVETPALLPALPNLSDRLLGEDLILPNAETWWCGDVRHCHHVLENLNQLIVKRAFTTHKRSTFSGMEMSNEEIAKLHRRIQKRPHEFIGQTPIDLSSAPAWNGQAMESRPIVLRVFVTATSDSYAVLPGGLTKVSASKNLPLRGIQLSGGSKDTWVIDKRKFDADLPAIVLESRPAQRMETGVPSRTADNFYWMGRYSERLEQLALYLNAIISRLVDRSESRMESQALEMSRVLGALGLSPFKSAASFDFSQIQTSVSETFYGVKCMGGVSDLCSRFFSIACSLRDRFSNQTWRTLNLLSEFPGTQPSRIFPGDMLSVNHDLMMHLSALSGIQTENVVRGYEWKFLDFGKRLERSQNLCAFLNQALILPPSPEFLLNPLLEVCDSSMTYRRQHYSEPEIASVLNSLLLDEANPRALKFNLNKLEIHGQELPCDGNEQQGSAIVSNMVALQQLVQAPWCDCLVEAASRRDEVRLSLLFGDIQHHFRTLSDSLAQQYFSLVQNRTNHHELP